MTDAGEGTTRIAEYAQCITATLNLAGLLASPRVARKLDAMPACEHVLEHLEHLDRLLSVLGAAMTFSDGTRLEEATLHVRELRTLCERWTPSPDVPDEIQRAARDLIAAFGVPGPPGGWENWEGQPSETSLETPPKHEVSQELIEVKGHVLRCLDEALETYFHANDGRDEAWILMKNPILTLEGRAWRPGFAAFLCTANSSEEETRIPDWVCEVMLPSDVATLPHFFRAYFRAGVHYLWLIDIAMRCLIVHRGLVNDPGRAEIVYVAGELQRADFFPPRERIPFDAGALWPATPSR